MRATAKVNYGGSQSVIANLSKGLSDRIGLQPGQTVAVTVQLTTAQAGRTVALDPLDGGKIGGGTRTATVAADGSFTFTFQAPTAPGIAQVSIRDHAQEIGIQFWVNDPQNPAANPPSLSPTPPPAAP